MHLAWWFRRITTAVASARLYDIATARGDAEGRTPRMGHRQLLSHRRALYRARWSWPTEWFRFRSFLASVFTFLTRVRAMRVLGQRRGAALLRTTSGKRSRRRQGAQLWLGTCFAIVVATMLDYLSCPNSTTRDGTSCSSASSPKSSRHPRQPARCEHRSLDPLAA